MERKFVHRENLQALLEAEWKKYKHAITHDKTFDEAKIIYLRIKDLTKKMDELTDEIHNQVNKGD